MEGAEILFRLAWHDTRRDILPVTREFAWITHKEYVLKILKVHFTN